MDARPAKPDTTTAFPAIEDYAAVGNLETVAMIANNGAVELFCYPSFDFAGDLLGRAGPRRRQLRHPAQLRRARHPALPRGHKRPRHPLRGGRQRRRAHGLHADRRTGAGQPACAHRHRDRGRGHRRGHLPPVVRLRARPHQCPRVRRPRRVRGRRGHVAHPSRRHASHHAQRPAGMRQRRPPRRGAAGHGAGDGRREEAPAARERHRRRAHRYHRLLAGLARPVGLRWAVEGHGDALGAGAEADVLRPARRHRRRPDLRPARGDRRGAELGLSLLLGARLVLHHLRHAAPRLLRGGRPVPPVDPQSHRGAPGDRPSR